MDDLHLPPAKINNSRSIVFSVPWLKYRLERLTAWKGAGDEGSWYFKTESTLQSRLIITKYNPLKSQPEFNKWVLTTHTHTHTHTHTYTHIIEQSKVSQVAAIKELLF